MSQLDTFTAFLTVSSCIQKMVCEEDKKILQSVKDDLERELVDDFDLIKGPKTINLTNFWGSKLNKADEQRIDLLEKKVELLVNLVKLQEETIQVLSHTATW